MKNNRVSLVLLGCAILLQCMCMRNAPIFDYELPFLTGLLPADAVSGNMLLTLYSIIPVPFLLMFFSGNMADITKGYGKLLLIRSYGKKRLILHLLCKTFLTVMAIVLIMTVIFTAAKSDRWAQISFADEVKGMMMYILTMVALVLLQYNLELYMEIQYANIAAIIGMTGMLFVSGILGTEFEEWNLLLFPNLAFAQKNGILTEGEGSLSHIVALGWIVCLCLFLSYLCMKKMEKKDIF